MKIKPCLYFLGLSCFPISIMALLNIFYSFYFDYLTSAKFYALTLFLSSLIGFSLFKIGKKEKEPINIYEQIFLIFLIYFLISFFIQIPIYFSDYNVSFIDSYFESISGLTGTGFTIFDNVKKLDPPLILWRSTSQWIGGLYFLFSIIYLIDIYDESFKKTLTNFISFDSSEIFKQAIKIFFLYSILTLIIFLVLNIFSPCFIAI